MATDLPTAVYIDGYNLYYGRIRGTPYKWLDLVGLFEHVLRDQDPRSVLARLHYFSAPALARFASHGQASSKACPMTVAIVFASGSWKRRKRTSISRCECIAMRVPVDTGSSCCVRTTVTLLRRWTPCARTFPIWSSGS
jgi:hypothetical protein